jgi:DNA sulfur modification protein DndB
MKIPAIRAKIGDWDYYVTTLTFEQVSQFVTKIDEHLHKSESLNDLIQRSISNNYLSIKDYILNQPSVFFNSLVLAVYNDYPKWQEIEFRYDETETFVMGLLDFPGNHKIFPVDGQHRVEGIKSALSENPELKHQKISAIFVGHSNQESGMQRTRRLFTTLNRYAKPVSLDDIIALDEDDSVAIFTRYLLEEYPLFSDKKVVYAKQKAIPSNNKEAITSIITLYQANLELLKIFFVKRLNKKATPKNIEDYLKYRRPNEEMEAFKEFSLEFWNAFQFKLSFIQAFINSKHNPAEKFRNNETGGNLLFRPIGFLPFIKAAILIHNRTDMNFNIVFERFNSLNMNIDSKPWHFVVWNPIQKKMIMNSDQITQLMLIYLFDESILEKREIQKLKEGYAAKISFQENVNEVLNDLN